MGFAQMDPEEAKNFKPKVILVDDENKITKACNYEKHGELV